MCLLVTSNKLRKVSWRYFLRRLASCQSRFARYSAQAGSRQKKKYTEFVIPCLADDASRSCSVVTGSARYARRSTSPSKRRAPNLATWHQNCHRWYVLPFRATAAGCGNHQVDATERIENKDNMAAMARRATFGVRCDHRTDEPNPKDIFC